MTAQVRTPSSKAVQWRQDVRKGMSGSKGLTSQMDYERGRLARTMVWRGSAAPGRKGCRSSRHVPPLWSPHSASQDLRKPCFISTASQDDANGTKAFWSLSVVVSSTSFLPTWPVSGTARNDRTGWEDLWHHGRRMLSPPHLPPCLLAFVTNTHFPWELGSRHYERGSHKETVCFLWATVEHCTVVFSDWNVEHQLTVCV